jgi:G8 domain
MFQLVEPASLLLLLFCFSTHSTEGAPSVRGAAIDQRSLAAAVLDVRAFVPLSCNREIASCQSFVKTFGDEDIKDDLTTIPCGQCFTMDHAGPTLTFRRGLDIQGKLLVPESYRLHVVSPLIVVQGELVILATQKPVDGVEQVVFTLTGEDNEQRFTPINENANKCLGASTCVAGKKAFIVAGGMVDIRGIAKETPTWTLLYDMINEDTIVLDNTATNWAPGAEILITSHTRVWNEHLVRTIESISTVSGKTALQLNETIVRPTTLVEDKNFATEVALLSRNVLIQGGSDPSPWHGGHFMVHNTPAQRQWVQGVEFRNMGQQGLLGRYPVHFHFCEDSPMSVVSKNTIRQSFQRCIVVHGTNQLRIEENIAFDTKGHCFVLEDGMEVGNEFVRNLGAQTGAPETIIPDNGTNGEESDNEPATFWVTNPTNSFIENVAAGSESSGYWFEPYLRGERKHLFPYTEPMKAPLTLFKDNVAHSNVGKTVRHDDCALKHLDSNRHCCYPGRHQNVYSGIPS